MAEQKKLEDELLTPEELIRQIDVILKFNDPDSVKGSLLYNLFKSQPAKVQKATEVCPECKGTGVDKFHRHLTYPYSCPDCKGTGKVQKADKLGTALMKILVEGGIVLKDATPTPSELLLAVEDVIKVQKADDVCPNPECETGRILTKDGIYDDCPICQGTGKARLDRPKLREKIAGVILDAMRNKPFSHKYMIADQILDLILDEKELKKQVEVSK